MSDSLISVIDLVLNVLIILTVARALFSWFDPGYQTQVGKLLHQVTEPIIAPIRQVMPRTGMIDLSPMVAIFVLIILQRVLTTAFAT
jgi:YggT family protein